MSSSQWTCGWSLPLMSSSQGTCGCSLPGMSPSCATSRHSTAGKTKPFLLKYSKHADTLSQASSLHSMYVPRVFFLTLKELLK